jgi:hypothetical protein
MNTIIRRLPLALAAIAAVTAITAGTATAKASWPANCEIKASAAARWSCVDKHLNALDARLRNQGAQLLAARKHVATLRARNQRLNACLGEFPTTKRDMYDNWYYPFYNSNLTNAATAPGYFNDYTYGGQFTPGMLEQTQNGWGVDIWMVRDTCDPATYNRPLAP